MDTSGFYHLDGDLLFGPNFVDGPDFSLRRDNPDDRDNDLNGSAIHQWYWFDSEEQAKAFFDIE